MKEDKQMCDVSHLFNLVVRMRKLQKEFNETNAKSTLQRVVVLETFVDHEIYVINQECRNAKKVIVESEQRQPIQQNLFQSDKQIQQDLFETNITKDI